MANKEQNYTPAVGFFFSVDFYDGSTKKFSSFKEVSGLSVKINTEDITQGGENGFKYRLPTGAAYQNLVLKRGLNGIFCDLNDAVMELRTTYHPGAHILSCCHYECRLWIESLPFNPA